MEIKNYIAATFLVGVGSIQMIGDLTGSATLKGLGAATHASPAPKVFTAHEGFETFSSKFFIKWHDQEGNEHQKEITKEVYKNVKGPYNRRNVYGAALSYGPVLQNNKNTHEMFQQVSNYAFCGDAPLLTELGIDSKEIKYPIEIQLQPRDIKSKAEKWKLNYSVTCNDIQLNNKEKNHA